MTSSSSSSSSSAMYANNTMTASPNADESAQNLFASPSGSAHNLFGTDSPPPQVFSSPQVPPSTRHNTASKAAALSAGTGAKMLGGFGASSGGFTGTGANDETPSGFDRSGLPASAIKGSRLNFSPAATDAAGIDESLQSLATPRLGLGEKQHSISSSISSSSASSSSGGDASSSSSSRVPHPPPSAILPFSASTTNYSSSSSFSTSSSSSSARFSESVMGPLASISSSYNPSSSFRPAARPPIDERALLAKAFFDLREYRRALWVLRAPGATAMAAADSSGMSVLIGVDPGTGVSDSSPLITFLRMYLVFLLGEKRKEEEMAEKSDPLLKAKVINRELSGLALALDAYCSAGRASEQGADPFCLYLQGIVHRELTNTEQAIVSLVESLNTYPCNWSAWQALAGLVTTKDQLMSLALRPHWITRFFFIETMLELPQSDVESDDVFSLIRSLTEDFPASSNLLAQTATAHYNARDYDQAQRTFEELREVDPYRLDGMDMYSNVLFVKNQKSALSFLAHAAVAVDKYRPQTCCIIGNYYR